MSIPSRRRRFTEDQYLKLERQLGERYEYLDGEIYAMAGESLEHGDITMNLGTSLVMQLKGTPCRALSKDTKIRSGSFPRLHHSTAGLYSYPDLVVVCGDPEYQDDHTDVILNPAVIIEVLSPSTEAFDRGEKFTRYQAWNPTLLDYLLVSQDRPQIEHFSRKAEGDWAYRRHEGLDGSVAIPRIGCSLKLADVYDRVRFSTT